MNVRTENLYDKVVQVTYEYLGPAADRFVIRQIRNHLHKDPDTLQRSDLRSLINWVKIAMSLLSDDEELVASYIAELKALSYKKGSA